MAKFICSICGFTHDGNEAPEKCPVCLAPASVFSKIQENEVVENISEEICDDSSNFTNHKIAGVENNEEKRYCEVDISNNIKQVGRGNQVISGDEEIVKIIEADGYTKAVEWYLVNNNCSLEDAEGIIRSIQKKYNVIHRPSEEELFSFIEQLRDRYYKTGEKADPNEFETWYLKVSNCDDPLEAIQAMADGLRKYNKLHGLKNIYGINNNGCMITILIAITSTLSVFGAFLYCNT